MLKRRDECQLDALALLVARFGCGEPILQTEHLVGIGRHPHRFNDRVTRRGVRVGSGAVVDGQHPLGAPRDLRQARVGRDRVQPGAQRAAPLKARNPTGGGIVQCPTERALWLPYVEVAEIDSMTDRACELGANLLLTPREGPAGWRSVIATPAGGEIALRLLALSRSWT